MTINHGQNARSTARTLSPGAVAEAAKGGDREAMAELFRRTAAQGRRTAAAWCDLSEVDDAVAEGFARALGSLHQLRDPAAVEPWILRCIARAAVDLSRRRARQRPSGSALDLDWGMLVAPSAAEGAIDAEERLAVRRALAEVPDHHRQLLCLRFHGGLSVREIAERLGAPEGTLRRRCMEASRQLEQTFLRHQLRPAQGACAPITQLLCRGARRPLSGKATRKVTAHLRRCSGCRERRHQLNELLGGFRR